MSATCPRCQGKGTIEPKRPAVLLALDTAVRGRPAGDEFTLQDLRDQLARDGLAIGERQLSNRLYRLILAGEIESGGYRIYRRCLK